jgi:hypothetical protein
MGFDDAIDVAALGEEPVPYLLWGELEADGKWRDGRIPRDLVYPVDTAKPGQRVWLKVKRYVDDAGAVHFTRYVDVTAEEGKST